MEQKMQLNHELRQTLVLSQQMEQSIKILELGTVELQDYIKDLAMENPIIDIDSLTTENEGEELKKKKEEWLKKHTVYESGYVRYSDNDFDPIQSLVANSADESLEAHLLSQMTFNFSANDFAVAKKIMGYLDDNGYITTDINTIVKETRMSDDKVENGIEMIQTLDPLGIGARNLSQCLILQLPKDATLEREIVKGYLDLMAKNRIEDFVKILKVSEERILEAFENIRRLNPKPGSSFSSNTEQQYITPDVIVVNFKDGINVLPCEFTYPSIKLSPSILSLSNSNSGEEVSDYIESKIKEVEWLQQCIEKRGQTLLRVAQSIVKSQERFFRYGPQYLNVLKMSKIAEELEVHESTVSRAVKDKYIQCTHGIFPMRHFFVQGLGNEDSGEESAHNIKYRIKDIIEDEEKPLSDQKIADMLKDEGIIISRRTVAKYRDEMQIPSSVYRR